MSTPAAVVKFPALDRFNAFTPVPKVVFVIVTAFDCAAAPERVKFTVPKPDNVAATGIPGNASAVTSAKLKVVLPVPITVSKDCNVGAVPPSKP
jgi:hypothetical protein